MTLLPRGAMSVNDHANPQEDPLIAAARAQEFGDQADQTRPASLSPPIPRWIHRYRVCCKLGEGGMGVVYEAEQQDPRRPVALKVVRGGEYVSDHNIKLFQREAQTLARLRHPHIAAIYESGCTEDGRHFFAMELVRGVAINQYVREHKLSLQQCLALFEKICSAVHYAHQRGVIHRDLKPANILIDSLGDPKILDFGLAKMTESDIAVTTVITEVGRIQGTLPYMSPEQARGNTDEIDLRSDIYALGVLLYELLTGQLPYDLDRVMLHEAVRTVCEQPPRRLSTINRMLRGDLETITLKALEKEPLRRYQSADALIEDIQRYLKDQPILARPPSAVYQLKKLIKRHKTPFVLASFLLLVIVAFGVWMTVMFAREQQLRFRAESAEQKALAANARSLEVQQFLADMLASADPESGQGVQVTVREVIDAAVEAIGTRFGDDPEVRATVLMTIGSVYQGLGLMDEARKALEEALTIRTELYGEDSLEVADTLMAFFEFTETRRPVEQSIDRQLSLCRRARALYSAQLGETDPKTLRCDFLEAQIRANRSESFDSYMKNAALVIYWVPINAEKLAPFTRPYYLKFRNEYRHGNLEAAINVLKSWLTDGVGRVRELWAGGHHEEARQFLRENYQSLLNQGLIMAILKGNGDDLAGRGMLACLYWVKMEFGHYDFDAIEPFALEAIDLTSGSHSLLQARGLAELAYVNMGRGRFTEAEALIREGLAIAQPRLPPDYLEVCLGMCKLGECFNEQKRYKEAESVLLEVARNQDKATEPNDALRAEIYFNLGVAHWGQRKFSLAITSFKKSLEINEQLLPRHNQVLCRTMNYLGRAQFGDRDIQGAEASLREALACYERLYGESSAHVANSHYQLGKVLLETGRLTLAKAALEKSVHAYEASDFKRNHGRAWPLKALGEVELRLQQPPHQAEQHFRGALGLLREHYANYEGYIQECVIGLASALDLQATPNKQQAAVELRQKLVTELAQRDQPMNTASRLWKLSEFALQLGDHQGAERLVQQCLEIRERVGGEESRWLVASARSLLGACKTAAGEFETAEQLLLDSFPVIRDAKGPDDVNTQSAARRVVELYEAWGRPLIAEQWKQNAALTH